MKDHESTDLEGAEHFAAADVEPPESPHPSEYEDDYGALYECPTCGEGVRIFGQRCPRCKVSMEWDRLKRESNL